MEYLAGMLLHSGLMFAERITLAHFSVSSTMNLPKSVGEPVSTVPPRSAIRALILGSARAALIAPPRALRPLIFVPFGMPAPGRASHPIKL